MTDAITERVAALREEIGIVGDEKAIMDAALALALTVHDEIRDYLADGMNPGGGLCNHGAEVVYLLADDGIRQRILDAFGKGASDE